MVILVACALAVLAAVALLVFGRGVTARWAREMAARQMKAGAVSKAQQWLAWSAWLDSGESETDLMQAVCFRHLESGDAWRKALESARRNGAPAGRIDREVRLGSIQHGVLNEGDEQQLGAMIEAGAPLHEVAPAFVHGYLARERPERAKMVLDAWAAGTPDDVFLMYMRGVYWRWFGQPGQAEIELKRALAAEPRHELARTTLAAMFEEQDRLAEALEQYAHLATRFAGSETASLGLARLLRKTGRLQEAQVVLKSLKSPTRPSPGVLLEAAQIELDLGNYREAQRHFAQAGFDRTVDFDTLAAASSAFALDGETVRADQILTRLNAAMNRFSRSYDLRVRLAFDPNDAGAAEALRRLSSSNPSTGPDALRTQSRREGRPEASELYALHCGACHGANGDGKGRAARHLFPKPRDLRTGKTRLVSTRNCVPTQEDIRAVIKQGMPGTSMRSFEDLSEHQQTVLAEEVLRLNAEGMREQLIAVFSSEGDPIDKEEVEQAVEICTTPGETVPVPPIGPPDPQAVQRGKDAYFTLGCDNCHGDDGTGRWDTPIFDEKGRPAPPRDLVHEPFKGGQAPQSIYLRISVGMPGTPHPASGNLAEKSLVDLVQYCLALSEEPKRMLTDYERAQAARRAYLSVLSAASGVEGGGAQ